jgi:hypothetical protein
MPLAAARKAARHDSGSKIGYGGATMKKTIMAKKKEQVAAKKNLDGKNRSDPMSGPSFHTWGFDLFKGI